ncbi:MAG: lipocalin family protein [Capnocytophaga sp.]|nr:lipocalin family protein [Capnocytophaga sp.]
MKKIILGALSILSLLVFSCKEETNWEAEQNPIEKNILGQWRLESVLENNKQKKLTDCDKKSSLIFFPERKIKKVNFLDKNKDCTFAHEDNDFSISENEIVIGKDQSQEKFTYSIVNNILTLTASNGNIIKYKKNPDFDVTVSLEKLIIGKWDLVSVLKDKKESITDCVRKSSIIFDADKARQIDYKSGKYDCSFTFEDKSYFFLGNQIIFQKGNQQEIYSYALKNNELAITYPNRDVFTYKKNTEYNAANETPEKNIVGLWRLISIWQGDEEVIIPNWSRKSSLTFTQDQKGERIQYVKNDKGTSSTTEKITYSISEEKLTINGTEEYSYSIIDGTLMLTARNQTIIYKKNVEYDPAKELIGTWYINFLKYDSYDDEHTLTTYNGCRGQEKVIFTDTDITIYQYAIKGTECKEIIYYGTYEISPDLSILTVTAKRDNTKGQREFELSDGVLVLYGDNGGRFEEKFYRKEQKYNKQKY